MLTQAINFAIIPFAAFAAGKLCFADRPYLALGLLLAALVPTSGMTISWTGFARGNLGAAVKMTVVGLILGALATPLYVRALLGTQVEVDLPGIFQQIGLIVFLPMAVGFATRQALLRRYGMEIFLKQLSPRFPGLSTLGVLGIVFIAIALKARAIAARPDQLLIIFIPPLLLYAFNYLLSTVTGKMLLPRGDAIALVYGTVMRNLSIALAVAINAFGPAGSEAALLQHEEGDLPEWLLAEALEVADHPDRYADRGQLVQQLIEQIRGYDPYAGTGCFSESFGLEDIRRTLRQLLS